MADFTTIEELSAFLQISIPYDSAAAERAIREATAVIKAYCHQTIELVEDDMLTIDSHGGTRIYLPELPVLKVTKVIEDGKTLVDGTDYQLGQYGILHRLNTYWAIGIQIITITYDHGYEPIPELVRDICTRAASRAYQSGLRAGEVDGVPGIQSTQLGDYSVSYGSEQSGGVSGSGILGASGATMLLPSEKAMLAEAGYRITRP